jgi:hypothetical protein
VPTCVEEIDAVLEGDEEIDLLRVARGRSRDALPSERTLAAIDPARCPEQVREKRQGELPVADLADGGASSEALCE